MTNHCRKRLDEAVAFLQREIGDPPAVAIILGSGLSRRDCWNGIRTIAFGSVPHFSPTGVSGHPGELWSASLAGHSAAILAGRCHFYEGYSLEEVVFPVRVLSQWGSSTFFLTNAAGGIRPDLAPGSLMLISDHINLIGGSPLRDRETDNRDPFVDLSQAYDFALRALALECGQDLGLALHEGVYAALPGPNFETPAEIRMLATLGADAVGMSTVPEVIALAREKRRVLGLSVISNRAAGRDPGTLNHRDVLQAVQSAAESVSLLLGRIVECL